MKTFQFHFFKDQLKLLKNHQEALNPTCLDYMVKSLILQYAIKVKVSEKQFSDCAGSTLF